MRDRFQRNRTRSLCLALCLLSLSACAAAPALPMVAPAPTATIAPRAMSNPADSREPIELASGQMTFLEFYSPLWATCKELVPIVHGLSDQYGDRIQFVRINIHDPRTVDLQKQLGFSTTPEFYLIDPQGEVLRHWDESVDVAELKRVFQALAP